MSRAWLAPLTGIAFIVLVIVGFVVGGEPPDANSPLPEIVNHYADNKDSVQIGAGIVLVGVAFLLFFAGVLRAALRPAEETGVLSAVALAGATVMATGAAIDSTISFALAEAAEDVEPVSVQALQALWDNDFMPLALGSAVFLLASGLSIVLHRSLPVWLGWVAIVLGVAGLTPVGFFAFMGGAVWILIVSVMLSVRARAATQPRPPAAPGAAPPAP